MSTATLERQPIAATEEERSTIAEVEEFLARQLATAAQLVGPSGETITLPASAFRVLRDVIHHLAQGNAVSTVPVQMELTTQQAADILNMSRQYLVQLLEKGEIAFHKTGTHRRIRYGDLMAYKAKRDSERRAGLRRLTQLSEELGLYDE
jgi:excisionase family DNA binding protein